MSIEIAKDLSVLVRAPKRVSFGEIDRIVESHRNWINEHMEKAKDVWAYRAEPDEEERLAYIEKAKHYLPGRIAHFSALMGLSPAGIKITSAATRYGSCSGKNCLCFSWRLMRYPEEAIDAVVVHELAHISHKNHSRDFYACINSVMPDYARRKNLLKTTVR